MEINTQIYFIQKTRVKALIYHFVTPRGVNENIGFLKNNNSTLRITASKCSLPIARLCFITQFSFFLQISTKYYTLIFEQMEIQIILYYVECCRT